MSELYLEVKKYVEEIGPVLTKAERTRINKTLQSFMDNWHNKFMKGDAFRLSLADFKERSQAVYSALNKLYSEGVRS